MIDAGFPGEITPKKNVLSPKKQKKNVKTSFYSFFTCCTCPTNNRAKDRSNKVVNTPENNPSSKLRKLKKDNSCLEKRDPLLNSDINQPQDNRDKGKMRQRSRSGSSSKKKRYEIQEEEQKNR